jgi:O-antigen ligase
MGLFFTLLYILLAYLTPAQVFGAEASNYHIQEILAVPTILCSIFAIRDSRITRMNQTYADIGLMVAIFLSVLFSGWITGAPLAIVENAPNLLAFFFVALNCHKKIHLQLLILVMLFVAVFVTINGYIGELSGVYDKLSSYYIWMRNDAGDVFFRLRGPGVIQDPNDFAQFLMGLLPCMFLFWKKGRTLRNVVIVLIPQGILVWGLFLTHSRGAMIAIAVALVVAFRKKLGLVRSAIAGGLLIVALNVIGFSGGRDISAANGEDRMAAWGAGLEMIKQHPLFGVGSGMFTSHYYMTAHNSIVICAAETGIVGLFFWILFVFSSVRDMYVLTEFKGKSSLAEEEYPLPQEAERTRALAPANFAGYAFAGPSTTGSSFALRNQWAQASSGSTTHLADPSMPLHLQSSSLSADVDEDEIRRMAGLLLVSFAGLLTTGWFLSRAFSMIFYIYGGIAVVIFRLAQEHGMEVPSLPMKNAAKWSALLSVGGIAVVYAILRVEHLLGN